MIERRRFSMSSREVCMLYGSDGMADSVTNDAKAVLEWRRAWTSG